MVTVLPPRYADGYAPTLGDYCVGVVSAANYDRHYAIKRISTYLYQKNKKGKT